MHTVPDNLTAADDLRALIKDLKRERQISTRDVINLQNAIGRYFEECGTVDLIVGDMLFDLKDDVLQFRGHIAPEFMDLFVNTLGKILLEDDNSPGVIDDDEALWLRGMLQKNKKLDKYEQKLLKELKLKSLNFPKVLNFKKRWVRGLEKGLYYTRGITFLAVAASIIAAFALTLKGCILTYQALLAFWGGSLDCFISPDYTEGMELFVSAVDVFLFAMVLLIFGIGTYELFITKIDPVLQKVEGRPSWMRIKTVDDLKSSLGKVILMVLRVC